MIPRRAVASTELNRSRMLPEISNLKLTSFTTTLSHFTVHFQVVVSFLDMGCPGMLLVGGNIHVELKPCQTIEHSRSPLHCTKLESTYSQVHLIREGN